MGNFDVDLDFGQIYEEKIKNLFEGDGRIEVKTERDIWADTGNMAIEIRYRDSPSGISSSHADYFVYYFIHFNKDNLWFISVEDLKKLIKENIKDLKVVNGGDNNWSEIVLIPRKKYYKHFHVYTFKY